MYLDRCESNLGRRRPFIFFLAVMVGLSGLMVKLSSIETLSLIFRQVRIVSKPFTKTQGTGSKLEVKMKRLKYIWGNSIIRFSSDVARNAIIELYDGNISQS